MSNYIPERFDIIQTLSWQARKATFIKKVSHETFEAVLQRFLPLIGADEFLEIES